MTGQAAVHGYGPGHPLYLGAGSDAATAAAARVFRLDAVVRATAADIAAIPDRHRAFAAGSAFRDARLVHHLRRLAGDRTDLATLIGLGDAFTSPRAAWQAWHATAPRLALTAA